MKQSCVWYRVAKLLWVGFAVFAASAAQAHKPSDSYVALRVASSEVHVRWDIALRDLDTELSLDANDDGKLSWKEVRSREQDIVAFALPHLEVSSAGAPCTLDPAQAVSPLALEEHSDGRYAVLEYTLLCAAPPSALTLRYTLFARTDPTHRGIASLVDTSNGGGIEKSFVLGGDAAEVTVSLAPQSVWRTIGSFVDEGVWHIWLGFDHILFLLSLLFPAVLQRTRSATWTARPSLMPALWDVLRIVTAFTVAHSITLTLAALDVVSLPSRLVESGIAATIILAALNNIYPVMRESRWMAAFAFGLIHGFGFAGALKDLGLSPGSLAASLFGFNVGVELGQIAIVLAFFPLAYALRKTLFYRRAVLQAGSVAVIVLASIWLTERVFNIAIISA